MRVKQGFVPVFQNGELKENRSPLFKQLHYQNNTINPISGNKCPIPNKY